MAFLKAAWAFLRGVKDALVLLFLLMFFGIIYAALSMSGGERPMHARTGALRLDLDGVLVEQPRDADFWGTLTGSAPGTTEYRVRDVVRALDAARTDARVKAVALDLEGFMGGGQVSVARVGAALDAVRKAGKPVYAFATAYEDDGYMLAAHATEVWLNPIGTVAIRGPGGSQLYFKGLIDKLGITTNIYRVGAFKSAVEPFVRTDQSPEARAANQALADRLWAEWQSNIAAARPKARIAAYVEDPVALAQAAKGDLALAAQRAGLVDRLGDARAFADRVATVAGGDDDPEGAGFAAIDLADYIRAHPVQPGGSIGVVTIAGDIVDGEAGAGTAGGTSIATLIRQAGNDDSVKALVLRIDSPGGSVLASEEIRQAVMAVRKERGIPVVASMGDVAASGGYWVATAADRIVAQPATITGSIGVFGILPSFEGALEKLGITTDGVRTTPLSGQPDVVGGVSPEFNQLAQMSVEDMYRRFLLLVSQARCMPVTRVNEIAQGRVWDGGTARRIGLVDQTGGLEDAVRIAATLAKLDPATARPLAVEPEPDALTRFADMMASEPSGRLPADLIGRQGWRQQMLLARAIADARGLAQGAGIRADCLECRGWRSEGAALPRDGNLLVRMLATLAGRS